MIQKIETRIEEHIESILAKETLCHMDYMTLTNELARLTQKQKEAKWEAESEERNKALMDAMKNMVACSIR